MHSLTVLKQIGLLSKARITIRTSVRFTFFMYHSLMPYLISTMRKLQPTMLARKRLYLQVHTFHMLVQIRALPKPTSTPRALKRPLPQMHNLPVFHRMVLLNETKSAHIALERAFTLVLCANVRHEIVPSSERCGALSTCVRSVRKDGGDNILRKLRAGTV